MSFASPAWEELAAHAADDDPELMISDRNHPCSIACRSAVSA